MEIDRRFLNDPENDTIIIDLKLRESYAYAVDYLREMIAGGNQFGSFVWVIHVLVRMASLNSNMHKRVTS